MGRGRPRGSPKVGGRKKGTNYAGYLRAKIEDMGIDFPMLFLETLKEVAIPYEKCNLMLKFMEFMYPKPRVEIEISVQTMEIEQLKEFMREGLVRLKSEGTPGN